MEKQSQKITFKGTHRQTPQRAHLLQIIEAARGPLSAAQIYRIAHQEKPNLGLATVYRTLKILQQEEAIRFVSLPDGVARFEKANLGRHHFQCRVCQKIWTIKNGSLSSLNGSRLGSGFIVEDHYSTFYGRCPQCKSAQPS